MKSFWAPIVVLLLLCADAGEAFAQLLTTSHGQQLAFPTQHSTPQKRKRKPSIRMGAVSQTFSSYVLGAPLAARPLSSGDILPVIQGGVTKGVPGNNVGGGGGFVLALEPELGQTGTILFGLEP